jgi:hypothetical protein
MRMAAIIRTRGIPSASPSIIPRLVPELLFVGPWFAPRPVPDGTMVVIWVTVKTEPSLPVVVDSCVTVAAVCDWAVVGNEDVMLADLVCTSARCSVLDLV